MKFIVKKQGSGLRISDKMGEISHGGSKLEHIISFFARAYDRILTKKEKEKKEHMIESMTMLCDTNGCS